MLKQFLWDDLSCCAHITSRPHQSVRSGSHLGSRYQNRWFMNSLPGGLWDLLCSLHNEWCEQNVLRPKKQGCYIRKLLDCTSLAFINTKTHVFWENWVYIEGDAVLSWMWDRGKNYWLSLYMSGYYSKTLKKIIWSTLVLCPVSCSSAQLRFSTCRFEQYFRLAAFDMFIASKVLFYLHCLIMPTSVCALVMQEKGFIRCRIYIMCLNTGEDICRQQYIQWILYTCSICKVIWNYINKWGLIKFKNLFGF